jgi:hypothetical protein
MEPQSSGRADVRTCDALNKTAGTGALAVVLVTVDDFVDQNAADLICATFRTVHDVLACEVNLLGCFRAGCIGYTIHGSKDKLYGLHTVNVALANSVLRVVLAATHFFGALSVATYNHWKTATAASCMTVMGSTLSKNSLIPG